MGDVLRLSPPGTAGSDYWAVAERLAAAVGVTPTEDTPPVTGDVSRFGLFINQALRLGLSPGGAERVVQSVTDSPTGTLPPSDRHSLTAALRERHDLPWATAEREVSGLERIPRGCCRSRSQYAARCPCPSAVSDGSGERATVRQS